MASNESPEPEDLGLILNATAAVANTISESTLLLNLGHPTI